MDQTDKLFIGLMLIILISCSEIKNFECEPEKGITYLLSDKDFIQQYSFSQVFNLIKSYRKNLMTYEQILFIYNQCQLKKISPLVILFKAQFETGMLGNNDGIYRYQWRENRIMAYGMHKSKIIKGKRVYIYKGFTNQISNAINCLRINYDNFQAGLIKEVLCEKTNIKPENGATFALYEYTPFFKTHPIYDWNREQVGMVAGNDVFIKYFNKYKEKIDQFSRSTK